MSNNYYNSGRSRGHRLASDEIELIRTRHKEGVRTILVAKEVRCSQRVVNKYYAMFGGKPHNPVAKKVEVIDKPSKPKIELPNRHYKSNFEI